MHIKLVYMQWSSQGLWGSIQHNSGIKLNYCRGAKVSIVTAHLSIQLTGFLM